MDSFIAHYKVEYLLKLPRDLINELEQYINVRILYNKIQSDMSEESFMYSDLILQNPYMRIPLIFESCTNRKIWHFSPIEQHSEDKKSVKKPVIHCRKDMGKLSYDRLKNELTLDYKLDDIHRIKIILDPLASFIIVKKLRILLSSPYDNSEYIKLKCKLINGSKERYILI
jgi:hypothetical protein